MGSAQESDFTIVELDDPLQRPLLHDEEGPVLGEKGRAENGSKWDGTAESRSTVFLVMLTVSLGGLQVLFSVLYSHGMTHLISLGLNRSEAAMTFVAGPICGIFLQPCFGLWSDHCQSLWGMRRPFIACGVTSVILSILGLAWTREITTLLSSPADWHYSTHTEHPATPSIAVIFTIYIFIAVQPVQSGTRALIADACPPNQQQEANGWASRITGVASVLGYLSAFMDLPRHLSWFGDTQFKNLSVLVSLSLSVTAALTCFFIPEANQTPVAKAISSKKETPKTSILLIYSRVVHLLRSVVRIPRQIVYIYSIQLFAWMGWYPYLLYVSTYVADIYIASHGAENSYTGGQGILTQAVISAHAIRLGAFTLLVSSIVALVTAITLPFLTQRVTCCSSSSTRQIATVQSVRDTMSTWLSMRGIWMASHLLFALCLFSTSFTQPVLGTVIIFGFVGISWAIANWYALLSIEISKLREENRGISHNDGSRPKPNISAGTAFGMHNIAICIPQVLISLGSSFFWGLHEDRAKRDPDSVGWVLRVGGVMALVALLITTKIRDPGTESDSAGEIIDQSVSGLYSGEGFQNIPYRAAVVA